MEAGLESRVLQSEFVEHFVYYCFGYSTLDVDICCICIWSREDGRTRMRSGIEVEHGGWMALPHHAKSCIAGEKEEQTRRGQRQAAVRCRKDSVGQL